MRSRGLRVVALVLWLGLVAAPAAAGASSRVFARGVPGTANLTAIGCANNQFCVAIGLGTGTGVQASGAVAVPVFHNQIGAPRPIGGAASAYPAAIACPSLRTCYAVLRAPDARSDLVPITFGTPGTPIPLPAGFTPEGVGCQTETTCVAVGYDGSPVTEEPATLPITGGAPASRPVPDLSGAGELRAVTCPTAGGCVVVGGREAALRQAPPGLAYLYGGGVLSGPSDVTSVTSLNAVACLAGTCFALGYYPGIGYGVVNLSGDHALEPIAAANGAIACHRTSSGCVVVGYNQANGTWFPLGGAFSAPPAAVAGTTSLSGVACPGPYRCYAVGASGTTATGLEGVVVNIHQ